MVFEHQYLSDLTAHGLGIRVIYSVFAKKVTSLL